VNARVQQRAGYREFLLVIIALVVSIIFAELATRLVVWITDRQPLLVSDNLTGWALKPNVTNVHAYRNGQFSISTDLAGNRVTNHNNASVPPDSRAIVLVGDSFAMGLGVGDKQHIGWMIAENSSRKVINLGVLGFDTGQQLIALESYIRHNPDQAIGDIIVLVFENDFREIQLKYAPIIGRTKPYFHTSDGVLKKEIYQRGIQDLMMDRSRLYWLVKSEIVKLLPHDQVDALAGVDVVLKCLGAMRSIAEVQGAKFTVLAYRYLSPDGSMANAQWEKFIRDAKAEDLTPLFIQSGSSKFIGFDGLHWNQAGHQLATAAVLELIQKPGM
jgi:hypothetical protein